MQDFYFCPRTQLSVHRGDHTVHPTEMKELRVRDLLEHRVHAFGQPVQVERVGEDRARFVFRGIDHNKTYGHDEPAANLLQGVVHLGTYYDKASGQFYF